MSHCSTTVSYSGSKPSGDFVAGSAGLTPLHQGVLEGNLQAVKLLVMHGADVNRPDSDTWTPLHAACAEGHAEIVR